MQIGKVIIIHLIAGFKTKTLMKFSRMTISPKIPKTSGLVKKLDCNAKFTEIEN